MRANGRKEKPPPKRQVTGKEEGGHGEFWGKERPRREGYEGCDGWHTVGGRSEALKMETTTGAACWDWMSLGGRGSWSWCRRKEGAAQSYHWRKVLSAACCYCWCEATELGWADCARERATGRRYGPGRQVIRGTLAEAKRRRQYGVSKQKTKRALEKTAQLGGAYIPLHTRLVGGGKEEQGSKGRLGQDRLLGPLTAGFSKF